MLAKQESWSVLLVGHWNRMIFTPKWVGERLFERQEIEALVALQPINPIIYRHPQVTLEVSQPRLVLRPRYATDESLGLTNKMSAEVLEKLPDTPLQAVGINFAFTESAAPRDLIEMFSRSDDAALAENNWEIKTRRITRQLEKDGSILNLSLIFDGTNVDVEFNYHSDVADNQAARDIFSEGKLIALRDSSVALLESIYDLHMEEEEAHAN